MCIYDLRVMIILNDINIKLHDKAKVMFESH